MRSEIRIFPREGGEIQRCQVVWPESWEELERLEPVPSEKALECFYDIYRLYLVPSAPQLFGTVVLFSLPEGVQVPPHEGLADPLTALAVRFRSQVRMEGDALCFADPVTEAIWRQLEEKSCLYLVRGGLTSMSIIPVADRAGYLTRSCPEAKLKVNGSFFIMDPIDCGTPYDHVGDPFGLFVKNGVVETPPLFGREALMVRSGGVSIEQPELKALRVRIGDRVLVHGENARFYARPRHSWSPEGGQSLVITGRRVAAVCGGSAEVPCSGFVVCPDAPMEILPGAAVTYEGMEQIRFGIQVGNSILRDGKKTEGFRSRFYDVRDREQTPFPPSLYPLDFDRARAARIALGADGAGKPMLLWAEGAAKLGHVPGVDSCGASLSEMAQICRAVGMTNAVNLDGGGSAQILVNNERSLFLSDRSREDHAESERPVPMGLMVR